MRFVKDYMKRFPSKFIFSNYSPKIIKHRLDNQLKKEAKLWQYEKAIKWAEEQDYVLKKPTSKLNRFEKFDRAVLVAEYSVCHEVSMLGGVILDIGCGVGRHIKIIMDSPLCQVKKVIGVDIGLELLKKALEKSVEGDYCRRVDFHLASADNLFFISNESIDSIIIMYRTFGNLPDKMKKKNLREVKRILKKKGHCVLSLGNRKFMNDIVKYYQKFTGKPKYYDSRGGDVIYGDGIRQHYFTKKEIISYFQQRGFTIERLYEAGSNFITWISTAG